MWLGNIASHVTVEGLFEVFNKFGELTDGAVFPARIGPLGYAFLNFRYVEDAVRAYEALNNHCVPALSASKLLKLRFKPAQVGFIPPPNASHPSFASRHLVTSICKNTDPSLRASVLWSCFLELASH